MLSYFSRVQLFMTLWTTAHQAPVHEIIPARILERVAISYCRGSSRLRDQTCITCVPCIGGRFFITAPLGKPLVWLIQLYSLGIMLTPILQMGILRIKRLACLCDSQVSGGN